MSRARPQLNTADPAQLDAASDLLDEGEAPDLGILIAARQERLRGGLSAETVDALELLECEGQREVHRLVLLCDHYRDNDERGEWEGGIVSRYSGHLMRLRALSPINATRCDADDEYRQARWLNAEMLYRAAAAATESEGARDEWLDRARDSRRQAFRDGLVHDDPGPSTREPQNDWERATAFADRQDWESVFDMLDGIKRRPPMANGLHWLACAQCGFYRPVVARLALARLPPFMAGVSLQVAALCGDRDLFDRSWSVLESRCEEPWQERRREILTPRECREMIGHPPQPKR